TAYQWHLLGDALAHMAAQIRDSNSLREDRVRDAASAYFRAGTEAFWTQRFAGVLLGTKSPLETLRLFALHPVELSTTSPERQRAAPTRPRPVRDPAPAQRAETEKPRTTSISSKPKAAAASTEQSDKVTWSVNLILPAHKRRQLEIKDF